MKRKFRRFKEFLNRWEWLILIIGLVVLFRIPSLFEPHHYGDEEIYFVMGRAWREGVPLYAGAFDHKPPLIYILAGIAESVFWFRFMLMGVMVLHSVLVWLVSEELLRRSLSKRLKNYERLVTVGSFVATFVFGFLTTVPRLEGNIANGELFMMMPITASLLILLKNVDRKWYMYLGAGLLAGIGLLVKVPVLFDFVGIILWYFFFRQKNLKDSLRQLINPNLYITVIGFIIPMAATIVNYYFKGIFEEYARGALLINFGYVSSWSTSSYDFNPFASGLFVRGMIVAAFTLFVYAFRSRINKGLALLSIWYVFSLFGALLSARPYPHYLLQPIVPLAILVPYLYFSYKKVFDGVVIMIIATLSIVAYVNIGFWYYPTISYYQNFLDTLVGRKSYRDYVYYFSSAKRNFPIAEFLAEKMSEDDQLYVWGSDSSLYNLLDRLPQGGKYIVNFHVKDFRAYDEVMDNLDLNKPEFIVVHEDPEDFPELEALLRTKYVVIAEIENSLVYLRL